MISSTAGVSSAAAIAHDDRQRLHESINDVELDFVSETIEESPKHIWATSYGSFPQTDVFTAEYYSSGYCNIIPGIEEELIYKSYFNPIGTGYFRACFERGPLGDYRNYYEKFAITKASAFFDRQFSHSAKPYYDADGEPDYVPFVKPNWKPDADALCRRYRPFQLETVGFSRAYFFGKIK